MRSYSIGLAAALVATALSTAPLHAQTVATQTGTVYQTQSMKSSSTFATDMTGMRITAYFADGRVLGGLSWGALDVDGAEYGVAGAGFRLSMPGTANTGYEAEWIWSLQNTGTVGLTRLVFNGAPGRTLFDAVYDEVRTDNSSYGRPLTFAPTYPDPFTTVPSPYAATSTVTYRNAATLAGATPLFDLFEEVDLVFGAALAGGDAVAFDLDTDTIGDGATLDPLDAGPGGPTTATPEPASFALVGGGLLALGGALRRRRAAAR